jgi:hypothetical protein
VTATEIVWSPQPGPQRAAIECPVPDIFFGGQRGGGKTDWLLGDFIEQESKYGGHAHGILFRRTLEPELAEVIKRSKQIFPLLGWTYSEQKHVWTAPSGATLKLAYLEREVDATNYQGHSYTWVGFDEAGNWATPDAVDIMWATLRSAHGVPCVRRLTGNPGGVGHHWLKQRYIVPSPPYEPHRWQPQPETHPHLWIESVFIPSRLEDNVLLMQNDPGYEDRIAAATFGRQALWQAWRYGNWDVIAGAYFSEWNQELHVLPEFLPPPGWTAMAGMDAGVRNPSWLGLAVKGPEGDVVVTHEWYWRQKDFFTAGEEVALAMRKIRINELPEEWDWNQLTIWGDSSMFADSGVGGLTQASEFQRGLDSVFGEGRAPNVVSAATVKGPGSRRIGAALVIQMLHYERAPDGSVPPHKRPLLRIHQRCEHLIRTLPALPVSPRDPEDVDTAAEDHPFDGLKMMLLANEPAPEARTRSDRSEHQHPGFHRDGSRVRPKKPLADRIKEWQETHRPPGSPFNGPMRPM